MRKTFVPIARTRMTLAICPSCVACKHERRVTPEGRYTWWRCVDCKVEGRVVRTGD